MTRLLLAPVLPPLLVAALALSACSSDDDGSDPPTTSSGAPADIDADASTADAAEALEDFDEALDNTSSDRLTDSLGKALVSVLPDATAYEVVEGRVVVDMDGSSSSGEDACAIADAARTGVGSTTPLDLRYDDGTVDCG